MSEKIVQFNEEIIKGQIKELVRGSVEKARVWVYGEWFDVIGDPRPWLDPEPPGDWNREVEVTATHG